MNQINDNEIDLFDLFITIWDGKWKIIAFVIISMVGVIFFQFTQPEKFKAITKIKPINSVEADRYELSNNLGFFSISPDLLFNMYIEQLDERVLFEDAIREVKLLDIREYEDREKYEKAIVSLASKIELLSPKILDANKKSGVREFWTIAFNHHDSEKWKSVLSIVDNNANKSVKLILKERFRTILGSATQKKNYEIEDVEIKIANAMSDYDKITSDRLAFLREQSAMARKIGVAKNTFESQTFNSQNGLLTNIETDRPFYLHGYEAIEEETALIVSREDKKPFVLGLLDLETKLRSLKQDQTLDRAKNLFASTPIESDDRSFSAAVVSVEATVFDEQNNPILILFLTGVISGMISVMYVLISNALRERNKRIT